MPSSVALASGREAQAAKKQMRIMFDFFWGDDHSLETRASSTELIGCEEVAGQLENNFKGMMSNGLRPPVLRSM